MNRRHIALIPAAGVGARFGAGKPKQYIRIHGKTVLEHTVAIFTQHPLIDLVAIVVSPDDPFINHLQIPSTLKPPTQTQFETNHPHTPTGCRQRVVSNTVQQTQTQ